MRITTRIALTFLLFLFAQATFANAGDIPVEQFFKKPEFAALQLSPNGKYIAVMSPINMATATWWSWRPKVSTTPSR